MKISTITYIPQALTFELLEVAEIAKSGSIACWSKCSAQKKVQRKLEENHWDQGITQPVKISHLNNTFENLNGPKTNSLPELRL